MRYSRQIFIKIIVYILAFLAFLPVVILGILQIPPIQKEISRKISTTMTRTFNTTAIVGRIGYSLDNKFVLKNLYIEDYNLDTLFFVNKVKVNVWEIFTNQINFSRLEIDGLKLRIRQDTNGYSNLLVFLDNLPTNKHKKSKHKGHINIKVNRIDIRNFDISYSSSLDSVMPGKFNTKNFHIYPLNLTIKNLQIKDSLYSFSLYDFSFYDKESGFRIKNISTDFLFTNKLLRLNDFSVDMSKSHIYIPTFQVHFDSIGQLSDYKSLEFLLIIDTSTVFRSNDIKFFAPELRNNVFSFHLSMTAFGSLSNINILPLSVRFGQRTMLRANAHIIGLPDINHTYIDVDLDTVRFLLKDITSIRDTKGRPIVPLPKHLYKLSSFNANGKVTGLINDFSAFIDFKSNLGSINTQFDVNITNIKHIKGYINIDSLHLGQIMDNQKFGKISLVDTFDIFKLNKQIWGGSDGNISSFKFNGYTYTGISANVNYDNKDLSVAWNINDPNLLLSIRAILNNKGKQGYHTNFFVNLDKLNFYPLHFDKEDPHSSLRLGITGKMSGHNINDFYGEINFIRPLVYIKNLEKIEVKHFKFTSVLKQYIQGLPFKEMFIHSDMVDASMIGVFELSSLRYYFQNLIAYYLPSLGHGEKALDLFRTSPENIGANIIAQVNLKNITPLTRIFAPSITLAPNTMIQAVYRALKRKFMLRISSDSLLLKNNLLIKPQLTINTKNDTLNLNFSSRDAKSGIFRFENMAFWAKARNDTVQYGYNWKNKSEKQNLGLIDGYVSFYRPTRKDTLTIKALVTRDSILINGIKWDIKEFVTSIQKNIIQINSFFQNPSKQQAIGIVGKVSPNPKDKLFVRLQLFDISQLNPVLRKIKLEGFLNGNTLIQNLYSNPIITSDNIISNLKINGVDLQMLTAISRYDAQKNLVSFKIFTQKSLGEQKPKDSVQERYIDINGLLNIKEKFYNVKINFRKFKLKAFYPYFQKVVSAISRFTTIHGKINIQGKGKGANIKGDLGITNAAFKLRPNNVTYTVNGIMGIHFNNDSIVIDTTTVISQGGTGKAKLWGEIHRTQFDDYMYNIRFVPDTFMILNLMNNGQHPFFGKAYVSGNSKIVGLGSSLTLNADLKTENNTDITFLVNSPKKISSSADFIKFINPDTINNIQITKNVKESNLDLNVNLEVDPQSKFSIIINEQTGEKLVVQGSGLLNIKLSPYGDFLLSGTLTIQKGKYNFSLENIVNKDFQLQPGSTIKWSGSPKDADLDLTAVYKINNVNLYDLTLDDNYWNVRTPVNCLIHIKGKLTEPDVTFDLDLPKADQRITSQIKNLANSEKTKQVLSLLVIGKFQPLPGLTYNPNQATQSTSAADVLSSQLASIISSIDPNLELGLNYQTKQQSAFTPEQLELALSYKLWNERITINTDVGLGSNASTSMQNNSKQFIGDVDVEVKLNQKGTLRLKAFNKTNRNEFFDKGPYTQGVGIFFEKDFTSLRHKPKAKRKHNEKKKKKKTGK